MTKEELRQEAEEWLRSTDNHLNEEKTHFLSESEYAERAYLAGAEPREKRIAELEQKLEQTEKDLADYQFNYPTIKELEKENAELKDMVKEMYFLLRNYDKFFLGDRLLKCFEKIENYNFLKESEVEK